MKRRSARGTLLILLMGMILVLTSCRVSYKIGGKKLSQYSSDELDTYERLAQNLVTMMDSDSETYLNTLSATDSITFEKEWQQWQDMIEEYGPFQGFTVGSAWNYGGDVVVMATGQFGEAHICFDSRWTDRYKLIEITYYRYPDEEEALQAVPEGVMETDITLNEGSEYELPGKITMPKEAEGQTHAYPAAVLIAGTGANDMDHTAGKTHPYRDLAWHLAEQGVITIRFDKRSFRYSEEWTVPTMENMSIGWEITDDAVAAIGMLKELEAVDSDRIFCIGHSLGGLVMPRIDEESGGALAGFCLLSVPDRPWQEAAYDQYLNYGLADAGSNSDIYTMASILESEKDTISSKKIDSFAEPDLLGTKLLGMPAAYWKDLNSYDYVKAYEETQKPVFILQGGDDYQILAKKDFAGWEEKMDGHENVKLKLYDGLNHLMMPSFGCFKSCYKEYDMSNHVSSDVISDIVAWIGAAS